MAKQEYLFDYTNDKDDDELFQNIILLTESLYENFKTGQKPNIKKKHITDSLIFLERKMKYLQDTQDVFEMDYKFGRFKDLSKYLDSLTINESMHNHFGDFQSKVSLTLDLVYTVHSKLDFYNDYLMDIQD